jgi:hypothetical protein
MATPTFIIYDSGTNNPPRVVIEHSPAFSNWGLLYRDSDDTIIFQSNGTPVLSIGLGSQKVGIGTDSPNVKLEVISTTADDAIRGQNTSGGAGVTGESTSGSGVFGQSDSGPGVNSLSQTGVGVFGVSGQRTGVTGLSNGTGVAGIGGAFAGEFFGNVDVTRDLTVGGTKFFKIDHPLDPANKYLYHASVESSDLKNIYDGIVVLDANGEAVIDLPAWFEALNKEFRYQLTPIGASGPNLYVAEEISNNRFKIAGGTSAMKVCWQVTGIRKDAVVQAKPFVVEQDKPTDERGYYQHPEAHGQPLEKGIVGARDPEILRQFIEIQKKTP